MDFVERGFRRFCSRNRAVDAKRVWVGDLRITDSLFELTEQERNQVEAGREEMTDHLYLVGDYEAAASIPIGATLARLEAENHLLPAAFYQVLTTNLYKWMRVYDYLDAQEHAEMWMEDLSDEELEASVYRKVDLETPACIKRHAKTLKYERARNLLREIRPHTSVTRELIRHLLEMDAHGQGHAHAWPGQLSEKDVPGIDEWLMDAENSRPGCLITWYENDAINACFDEEAQHRRVKDLILTPNWPSSACGHCGNLRTFARATRCAGCATPATVGRGSPPGPALARRRSTGYGQAIKMTKGPST